MSQRLEYIDLAKGVCIMLVVLFHLQQQYGELHLGIVDYSSLFRMPLYFFLSGLFFKKYSGFIMFLKKKVNNLLIPFFFFYLVFTVLFPNVFALLGIISSNANSVGWHTLWQFIYPEFFFNGPIWFLLCLFEVNVLYYAIYTVCCRITYPYSCHLCLVFCIILGYLGYSLGKIGNILPAYIDTSLTALPFFSIGNVLKEKTNLLGYKSGKRTFLFIVGILICFALIARFPGNVNFRINQYDISFTHLIFSGIIGVMGVLLFCFLLNKLPLISYWGRYSIIVLLTHNILILVISPCLNRVFESSFISFLLSFVIIMFSYLLIIPLFCRYFPYVTAQKPLLK